MKLSAIPRLAPVVLFALAAACGSSSSDNGNGNGNGTNTDGGGADGTSGPNGPGNGDGGPGTPGSDGGTTGNPESGTPGSDGGVTATGHIKTVFFIVMENNNWSSITGGNATYINGTLLKQGVYCDNYFDNPAGLHPSEPNYIWMEAGGDVVPTSASDGDPTATRSSSGDHLVAQLTKANVSWKAYQEDLPAGHCGTKSTGFYAAKHNPMVYFTDVSGSPPSDTNAGCISHVVPYSTFASDLAANTVARYNFLTPNLCNDMHGAGGCTGSDDIARGDGWLATEVPKILASAAYKDNGALFITWDESEGGEFPIGMIVLSPLAKAGGTVSHIKYYHSSFLRSVEEIFGVPLLGDAKNQANLSDMFTSFP